MIDLPSTLSDYSSVKRSRVSLAAVFSQDHKTIGKQFLFTSMLFALLGGALSMLMRWQLAYPNKTIPLLGEWFGWHVGLPPDVYTMMVSMHGTIMIFFVIIPTLVGAFGNFLIPLKIGARDMAFPFLNGLSFWATLPAAAMILSGFWLAGGAAQAGWTVYPPLSAIPLNRGVALAGNVLRIDGSTWPMFVCAMNALAWLVCAMYIALTPSPLYSGERAEVRSSAFRGASSKEEPLTLDLSPGYRGEGTRLPLLRVTIRLIASTIIAILLTRAEQLIAWDGQSCWFLSILLLGISNVLGAINYLTTIALHRCAGLTMFRLPLSVWNLVVTALLVLFATPVLSVALIMNLLEHQTTTTQLAGGAYRFSSFFTQSNWVNSTSLVSTSGGGVALLHQHLFWFYSHPAVYIMILPAMGFVTDILATFSRKPVFGYRPMVTASIAIGVLGFLVWAHHMFQSGMNPALGDGFAAATLFIAVPSGVKTFNWLGTIWRGTLIFETPMLHALAFVGMFVIGGMSGIFLASTPLNVHLHDTVFIVAHIHYVLFGGSIFGILAATTFYFPKMFGRMMNHRAGVIHFWLTLILFNCTFFAMHIEGLGGVPRRVSSPQNYDSFVHFVPMNRFISHSAWMLGMVQLIFLANFFHSLWFGKRAVNNPWRATTLEWETTSPPPKHNFETLPIVHHGPYEYASPLIADDDYLPQTRAVPR